MKIKNCPVCGSVFNCTCGPEEKPIIDHKFPTDKYGRYGKGRRLFTIFTKNKTCGRGEYAEELDVYGNTPGKAKNLAQKVLDAYYNPGLRISRIEMIY